MDFEQSSGAIWLGIQKDHADSCGEQEQRKEAQLGDVLVS